MTRGQLLATALSGLALGVLVVLGPVQGGSMDRTPQETFEIRRSDAEWRRMLTLAQYSILRRHDTEFPGSSPLLHEHRLGTYHCAGCGQPLFSSEAKFDSGTGWPSFTAPLEGATGLRVDRTLAMVRTEVHCQKCGGHLGHVFSDGPPPTGQRYCINGAALVFTPAQ